MTNKKTRVPPIKELRSRCDIRKESIDDRIVTAALERVMRAGASKLALADVAGVAAVSHTTLYKYYRTRDALLSAVSKRVRDIYETELRAAIEGRDNPRDRLSAVLRFMSSFHKNWKVQQMIDLQIEQIVGDIRKSFSYYFSLIDKALTPAFALLERRGLGPKGRKLLVELLIRTQLSNAIVPLGKDWTELPRLLEEVWTAYTWNLGEIAAGTTLVARLALREGPIAAFK
jgi:AcrR family transcriptional regulator